MKKVLAIIISLFLVLPLSAIGFGYHVLDINTSPEFSVGGHFELPVSLVYQFNFPVPDLIQGSSTSFAFRLDNGLSFRTLKQDPETGRLLSDSDDRYPERDYIALYDEFNLEFAQGFFRTDFASKDLLTLKVSIDGRFENAYERLSYFSNSENREGLFHTLNADGNRIIDRSPFNGDFLPGTPELSRNRSVFQTMLTAGVDINFMKDDVTLLNGFKLSSLFSWALPQIQFFSDTADFFIWDNSLDLAWTFFRIPMTEKLSGLSLIVKNRTEYRYVHGSKVPYYATENEIWGFDTLPTEHAIINKFELMLTGPQIGARDLYPFISLFFDLSYNFGRIVNSDEVINGKLLMSFGARAELVIFNVSTVYYEIGYLVPAFDNSQISLVQKFGFRVGL